MTDKDKAAKLKAKLAKGEKIRKPEEMTPEYKEQLVHLMMMQADSELAGALGYVPWIGKAPNIHETLMVAQIVKDEVRHARVMYRLLEQLGVDVDAYFKKHDFDLRVDDKDIGTLRKAADQRVNIFYYPIDTWHDFVMFNFCMDRGAGHQLEDAKDCSYEPWCEVMDGIFKEENMHIAHGDEWTQRLASDPKEKPKLQAALDKWYVRTMNIFGRRGSPRNKVYRELGLKKRDNDEVRQAFAAEVAERCREFGLRVPGWKPSEKMTEEPFIPG